MYMDSKKARGLKARVPSVGSAWHFAALTSQLDAPYEGLVPASIGW